MVLVDTSVWVGHLRIGEPALVELLESAEAACHPFVIGELACGGIRNRENFLALLSALPMLAKVSDDEAVTFIDAHALMGRGLGLVDVHLLASCALNAVPLWTRDRELAAAAGRLGLAWQGVAGEKND